MSGQVHRKRRAFAFALALKRDRPSVQLDDLVDNRERVVPREEILERVWEYSREVSSRTIDVHIAWLRQKLESDPQVPRYIQTIRGKGYRFSA